MWTSTALSVLAATSSFAYANSHQCRCRPHEPCWPSEQQWQTLNSSIDGNLEAIRPIASVCHEPTFDDDACQEVTAMAHNSTWRSSQPGADNPALPSQSSSWSSIYSNIYTSRCRPMDQLGVLACSQRKLLCGKPPNTAMRSG